MILTISGIRCDNPECNYRHDEVALSDYGEWLNKPCPHCGENLLTEADFNISMISILKSSIPYF